MKEDMHAKTKCHIIQNNKWERKQYINNVKYHNTCHENQITYVEHKMQLQKK